MNTLPNPEEQIRQAFVKHVPEIASGAVELVAIAREAGQRVSVAVRSHDPGVDAMSACLGERSIHLKNIVRELGGERVTVVRWSESPERFVLSALGSLGPGPMPTPKVKLDVAARIAYVEVTAKTLAYLSKDGDSNVSLASKLVGWTIKLVSHEHS